MRVGNAARVPHVRLASWQTHPVRVAVGLECRGRHLVDVAVGRRDPKDSVWRVSDLARPCSTVAERTSLDKDVRRMLASALVSLDSWSTCHCFSGSWARVRNSFRSIATLAAVSGIIWSSSVSLAAVGAGGWAGDHTERPSSCRISNSDRVACINDLAASYSSLRSLGSSGGFWARARSCEAILARDSEKDGSQGK